MPLKNSECDFKPAYKKFEKKAYYDSNMISSDVGGEEADVIRRTDFEMIDKSLGKRQLNTDYLQLTTEKRRGGIRIHGTYLYPHESLAKCWSFISTSPYFHTKNTDILFSTPFSFSLPISRFYLSLRMGGYFTGKIVIINKKQI